MIPNASRDRLLQENQAFTEHIPNSARVLDAGAGHAPYRHLLSHAHYESADFAQVPGATYDTQLTYICDLRSIPVEDGRYDYVLFNQVMEHLPDPGAVLKELYRVMRPGAKLIYTAPLYYEQHQEPYDFYRYTSHGIKHLFEAQTGFRIKRLDWLEGYFGTVSYQLHNMAEHLPLKPSNIAPWGLGVLLCPLMFGLKVSALAGCLGFYCLERMKKYTGGGHPKNYVAIVMKP